MPLGPSDNSLSPSVEDLYSKHHGWLEGWLRRKMGDAFIAADLAQDTFVSVIVAGTASQIQAPRPFLATIARRLVAHHYRRRALEEAYLEELAALPEAMTPSSEVRYLALEALRELDRALDGLPPQVKEAFLLVHVEHLSYADIATRLKVSSSSVKQYLTRAHRHCLFALAV